MIYNNSDTWRYNSEIKKTLGAPRTNKNLYILLSFLIVCYPLICNFMDVKWVANDN